jgi:UDP-N-acetylmuramoyl-tripeptide--D-alanyl-D-alanine ligase
VIGHISDYRGDPVPKYRGAYQASRAVADQVIMVGDHAHEHRASEEDRKSGRVVEARTARDVFEYLRDTAMPGELILLKSSKNLHLERAALAFSHDVRCWVDNCGLDCTCMQCGLFGFPREQHKRIRGRRRLARLFRRMTGC